MSRLRPQGVGIACAGCGDGWTAHGDQDDPDRDPGGPCTALDDDGRCPCLGFRWLDVEPPADPGYPRPRVSSAK